MRRPPFSTVAVVVFDRAPLFETSIPISIFGVDRTSSGAPPFTLLVVAGDPGPSITTGGVTIGAAHGLRALERADVVVVPTWRDPDELPTPAVVAALRRAHARGTTIVGLCLGAFVLAAAGLLDGRRVATHWLHAATLAERYPAVSVDDSVLFVDDGDLITSAGTAAGLDACLHLLRSAHGAHAAAAVARRMVVAPQRTGGQTQFIEQPLAASVEHEAVGAALAHALDTLDTPLGIDELAERAHMSRRSFDRHVRRLTGGSPHQWLLQQRVLQAQQLLEHTDLTIDVIARRVGFGTAVSLRPHFRRLVGTSPNNYRATFATSTPRMVNGG